MSYPDNRFTTNQPGPNDRRDFQNTQGSGIAQDSAGYNTSNMQEGIPAPHQAGTGHHGHHGQHGTTHGASHHDRDTGNFRGERGSEFVGRGGTNDVQGYGGPGTASGYGPPSGAAAASGMGTNRFDQNAMNTGAGANPSYDDPTWAGNERQFANNGPGMGAGAGAAGTNMGMHHGITGTGGPTTGTHHAGGTGTGVGTGVGTGMGTGPTSGTHHLGRTGAGTAGAMGTGHTGTGTATGAGYDDFSNTRGTGQFQDQRADFNTQGASNRGPGTGNATIGDKLKGAMDKMVGKATDNPQLQQQGQARQTGH